MRQRKHDGRLQKLRRQPAFRPWKKKRRLLDLSSLPSPWKFNGAIESAYSASSRGLLNELKPIAEAYYDFGQALATGLGNALASVSAGRRWP